MGPGTWREKVVRLKQELRALALAVRHSDTPWYAKAVAAVVVGYALSPIDLIPDVIPVLGYLDDMVLLPLGFLLCVQLIPDHVLDECRARVSEVPALPVSRRAAVVVIGVWAVAAAASVGLIARQLG